MLTALKADYCAAWHGEKRPRGLLLSSLFD
jgi:hypothetical protein